MGPLDLITTTSPLMAPAFLVSGTAAVLRAWIAHRTAVRLAAERTRRVGLALTRAGRGNSAEVVRACAELEAAVGPDPAPARPAGRRQGGRARSRPGA
ncbi:hypothetical protein ACGFZP_14135 [Kitasatospora sp. NPDC048239]|uniref:hypothetical protein n=1 Tax=Kitasatospora sp. NPDC048239 TaxID=3364046 RepID=UPI003721319B